MNLKNCTCPDIPDNTIHKIAAAFTKDKKLIVVKKKGKEEFISLGGIHDGSESHEANLRKEAREELKLELTDFPFLGRYKETAVFEDAPIILDLYLVDCTGTLTPNSEIKEYLWVDKNYEKQNIKLASGLRKFIIPTLIEKGLM
jgi:8-oxo-dGTP pyrophosphatase MutT (NUDIX family)